MPIALQLPEWTWSDASQMLGIVITMLFIMAIIGGIWRAATWLAPMIKEWHSTSITTQKQHAEAAVKTAGVLEDLKDGVVTLHNETRLQGETTRREMHGRFNQVQGFTGPYKRADDHPGGPPPWPYPRGEHTGDAPHRDEPNTGGN